MLEHVQERVEQLARMTVLTDSGDLPGLVALQEQAVALASELDADHAGEVAELARQVSTVAEAIVLRQVPDADAAFGEIGAIIERLQRATNESSTPMSGRPGPDDELITAWIGGCEGMLAELEGRLLTLEKSPADRELIADIRRSMHTLKGECGVLSLHTPQQLCHEAESLIDTRLDSGLTIPIDPFLLLLDWLKSYVAKLSIDRTATPDDGKPVMEALLAAKSQQASLTPQSPSSTSSVTPLPAASHIPVPAPASLASANIEIVIDPVLITFAAQQGTEENLPEFLCEAKDHLANSEEALLALDQDRTNSELINTVFRAFHTIKGVSGFMALTPIVSLAHSAEQLLDGARAGTLSLGRTELDLILASCDMLTRLLGVLEGTAGPPRGDLQTLINRLNAAATSPGSAASMDLAIAPSIPVNSATTTPAVVLPPVVVETKAIIEPPSTPPPTPEADGTPKTKKSDQTVKVSTNRMDSLVTMVGELVIAQQMVAQDVLALGNTSQTVQRTLSHMSKMIRELQEVSMSLRMVNLKSTFQKMTRLVRDVSQKTGKHIEVVTEGDDVELDRNVVEAITDPLVHMIRNACDHGVDSPDERRAAGKPATGRVSLRAYHSGGSIVIEIADDGRGLRREKLLAKAKSKGLLPADLNEASMPDAEVFALIFLPGFSTAEKITETSGRGVGMDVVRRNIEALRGKVEIRSTPGQGTTFVMRLPLTMAIIDGMVVRVGTQRYVLPTLSIQQSFRPRADDIKTVVGAGEMVKVRGSMLPVYRLNRVLHLEEGATHIADGLMIVLETHDSRFCLMVDEILGQHSVVIKSLTQIGQRLRGVSGGAILGDGRVALILDVSQVVSLAREGSDGPIPRRGIGGEAGAISTAREQVSQGVLT